MRTHLGIDLFSGLRRRSRAVLGAVLPLLVVGFVGTAGPCVGMAADGSGTGAGRGTAGAARGEPADAGSDTDAARGEHAHAGSDADPAHGERARAGIRTETADDGPAPASHGACPHCPGTTGPASAAHALCGALADVSDAKRKPSPLGIDVQKATLAGPAVVEPAARPEPTLPRPRFRRQRAFPPAVPINVRHCVFIV